MEMGWFTTATRSVLCSRVAVRRFGVQRSLLAMRFCDFGNFVDGSIPGADGPYDEMNKIPQCGNYLCENP